MKTLRTARNRAQRTGDTRGQRISSALALLLVTTLLLMELAPFDVAAKNRDRHNQGDAQVQTVQEEAPAALEEAPAPREDAPAPEQDPPAPREEDPPADGGGNQGGEQNQNQAQDQNQTNEDSGRDKEAPREEGNGSSSDSEAPRDETPREDGQDGSNGGEGTSDGDPGQDGAQEAPTEDAAAPGDASTEDQTAQQDDDEAAAPARERNRDEETPGPEVTPIPPPVVHVSGDAACSDRGAVEGVAIVRVDDAPATITDILVVPSPDSPPVVPALRGSLPATVDPGRAEWRWSLSPQTDGGTGWFPTTVLVRVADYAPNGSGDEGWLSADLAPFAQPCAPPAPETAESASASDGAAEPEATAVTDPAEEPREESGDQASDAGQAPSLAPGDAVVVTAESELREGSSWSVLLVVPAGTAGEIVSGPYQAEDGSWWYEVAAPQATGFLVAGTLTRDEGDGRGTDDRDAGGALPSPTATTDPSQEPSTTPEPTADATTPPEPVDEESSGSREPDAEAPTATPEPTEAPDTTGDPTDEAIPTPEPTEPPVATATPEPVATPIAGPTGGISGIDAITVEAISPDDAVTRGETGRYHFRLINTSDSPLTVRPVVSNSHEGWSATLVGIAGRSGDGAVTLGVGEQVDVAVEVVVPEFAPAGEKNTTTLSLEAAEDATG